MAPHRLPSPSDGLTANGLLTILCATPSARRVDLAALGPTAILLEPPALIGAAATGERDWIVPANDAVRRVDPSVLMMHAGGVSSPSMAEAIMASGADGTGSTSGVLDADDPRRQPGPSSPPSGRAGTAPTPTGAYAATLKQRSNDERGNPMLTDLSGRTAVITGGARGIGLTLARALAADGANIALLDLLDTVEDSAQTDR